MTISLGGVRCSLCHVTPRMKFREEVGELARERAVYPSYDFDFNKSKPIYQKVGKSRKKATLYEVIFNRPSDFEEQYDAFKLRFADEVQKILDANEVKVKCHCRVIWTTYGKLIEVCMPYEIKTDRDVEVIAEMFRVIGIGMTAYVNRLPFVYDAEKWAEEGHENNFY